MESVVSQAKELAMKMLSEAMRREVEFYCFDIEYQTSSKGKEYIVITNQMRNQAIELLTDVILHEALDKVIKKRNAKRT